MRKKYGETDQECASRLIREKREAAAYFPALCKVIRQFDGKVYNKRFDNAIKDSLGRSIYTNYRPSAQYGNLLSVYQYNSSQDQITILNAKIPENKRISADTMIQQAAEKRAEILQEAAHLEMIAPTLETRRGQIEYIKELLDSVLSDLTMSEKCLFDLYYRLQK